MKSNVSFKPNEVINGYRIHSQNGLNHYTAENDEYIIRLLTDAGVGINYSKVLGYTDKKTGRMYQGWRYLQKHVHIVQHLSNVLFLRYKNQGGENR